MVNDDYNWKFEDLLTKDDSLTINHQNIQTLAIDMFKIHNGFLESLPDFFHNYNEKNIYSFFCSVAICNSYCNF